MQPLTPLRRPFTDHQALEWLVTSNTTIQAMLMDERRRIARLEIRVNNKADTANCQVHMKRLTTLERTVYIGVGVALSASILLPLLLGGCNGLW